MNAAGSPTPEVQWLKQAWHTGSPGGQGGDAEALPGSAVTTVSSALEDAQGSVLVLSRLRLGPLTREDLHSRLVCQVDNSVSTPVRASVKLDMNCECISHLPRGLLSNTFPHYSVSYSQWPLSRCAYCELLGVPSLLDYLLSWCASPGDRDPRRSSPGGNEA